MTKLTFVDFIERLARALRRRLGCATRGPSSAPGHRGLGHAEPLRCPGAYALLAGVSRR